MSLLKSLLKLHLEVSATTYTRAQSSGKGEYSRITLSEFAMASVGAGAGCAPLTHRIKEDVFPASAPIVPPRATRGKPAPTIALAEEAVFSMTEEARVVGGGNAPLPSARSSIDGPQNLPRRD